MVWEEMATNKRAERGRGKNTRKKPRIIPRRSRSTSTSGAPPPRGKRVLTAKREGEAPKNPTHRPWGAPGEPGEENLTLTTRGKYPSPNPNPNPNVTLPETLTVGGWALGFSFRVRVTLAPPWPGGASPAPVKPLLFFFVPYLPLI